MTIGQHRFGDQPADRRDRVLRSSEPGADDERAEPWRVVEHMRRQVDRGDRRLDRPRRGQVHDTARHGERHESGAAAQRRPTAHSRAAPSIDALPATTRTAPFHLCGVRGAPRPPRRDIARLDEVRRRSRRRDRCRQRRPRRTVPAPDPISMPGFSAWKVTVRSASSTPPPHGPVAGVERRSGCRRRAQRVGRRAGRSTRCRRGSRCRRPRR